MSPRRLNPNLVKTNRSYTVGELAEPGERLSKATLPSTLRNLRAFFEWLPREPVYSHAHQAEGAGMSCRRLTSHRQTSRGQRATDDVRSAAAGRTDGQP